MQSSFLRPAFFLVATLIGALAHGAEIHEALPHWIGPARASTGWVASRSFTLPAGVQRATLRVAADFCSVFVNVNGNHVLGIDSYCPTQVVDVTSAVQHGTNRISFVVGEGEPPHGVALSLTFTTISGSAAVEPILSDELWICTGGGGIPDTGKSAYTVSRGKVRPELWGVGRRDASVSPLENYEQWRQSTATGKGPTQKFYTPPDFEVSLVRTAAADEGSWIALAFDPQGRAVVSREDQGFLRFTLDDKRASVTEVEAIESDLKECRGLLFAHDRLYADANNSKGLYSLQLTNDGQVANQKLLRAFPGDVGHGRNDLALGRDGAIYAIFGDSVARPEGIPTDDFIDRTSPLRTSRENILRREKPLKEGWVVRTDRDEKQWELFCCGLRNPYGIAAHPNGDLFTYDADNEFDMGTPWYRPTRILQLRSGADFGYNPAADKRRPNFVDNAANAQPVIDVGRGSPTAVMFGDALRFPPPYRYALFVLDWTYGRVLAVHLDPRGGGYRAAVETFLQGRPLNVTDVAAGPDGAMYLITGGRKTQSALYRVAYIGKTNRGVHDSRHESEASEYSEVQRTLRRQIEQLHGIVTPEPPDIAIDHCNHADPTIRYAARIVLESRPAESWKERVWNTGEDAIATIIRASKGDEFAAALKALQVRRGYMTKPRMLRKAFVEVAVCEEALRQNPELTRSIPKYWFDFIAHFEQLFRYWGDDRLVVSQYGTNHELRRRLIYLLAKLEAPQAIDLAAKSLLVSPVQEDKLAALSALSTVKAGWTPETRRLYFTALRDGRHFVGGQGMPGFLDQIRSDAVATLTDEEQKSLADLLAPPKDEDEPLPPPRAVVKQWTLDELAKLAAGDDAQGDATRGGEIFRAALCSRCHRAGANGPAVGPDLSFVAARFSRRDILHSILTPAAAVAEQYRNSEVITADGRTLVGRVVAEGDYRSEKLLINVDPLRPSKVVEVDKKEIAEHRLLGTSPMPAGLLDGFTAAEVRDLLAFLEKPQTTARQ